MDPEIECGADINGCTVITTAKKIIDKYVSILDGLTTHAYLETQTKFNVLCPNFINTSVPNLSICVYVGSSAV